MHDGEVAHERDIDVMCLQAVQGISLRRIQQELLPVDERSIGQRAEEVIGQDLAEATDVRLRTLGRSSFRTAP
jgi:hypothetical protein